MHTVNFWQRGYLNPPQFYRYPYLYAQGKCGEYFQEQFSIPITEFNFVGFAMFGMFQSAPWRNRSFTLQKLGLTEELVHRAPPLLLLSVDKAREKPGISFDNGLHFTDPRGESWTADATARARFAAEATTDISRVGYGVAFKSGAPKPDVGTPDAMKAALLQARSVTFYPESAAGAYVMKTFERLGISEAMKAKTKPQQPGQIAAAVAKGDAELAVFLTNLLIAPGAELAGPFPAELQNDLVFVGAVAADSKEADAAKAFIAYLKTPEAAAVFKAKGVKPG